MLQVLLTPVNAVFVGTYELEGNAVNQPVKWALEVWLHRLWSYNDMSSWRFIRLAIAILQVVSRYLAPSHLTYSAGLCDVVLQRKGMWRGYPKLPQGDGNSSFGNLLHHQAHDERLV